MIDHDFNCEDCDKGFDHEDDGYMSEAGFECHECYDKRIDAEHADYLHWAATSTEAKIRRNYPDLDANVAHSKRDPVGFYLACKNGTI